MVMQNILGAVEKFSIKRRAQDVMIRFGIIEWVCKMLRNAKKLHEYTLEYVAALLMNLVLRTEGKRKCEDPRLEILCILKPLLERESQQIRTYINGTLYSLFTSAALKAEAKRTGFVDLLQRLMKGQNGDSISNQLKYMLAQLASEEAEECVSGDEEKVEDEADEDMSYFAEEEEEDKEIQGKGVATGEELLMGEFIASTEDALQQSKTISQQLASQAPQEDGYVYESIATH